MRRVTPTIAGRVKRRDRRSGVAAQSRPIEDRLDEERVDKRVGEDQCDHRCHRVPRELHGEAREDRPLREAKGAHHLHVGLAERVEHRRTHHPGDHARWIGRNDQGRQDEMGERTCQHRPIAAHERVDHGDARVGVEGVSERDVRVVLSSDRQHSAASERTPTGI